MESGMYVLLENLQWDFRISPAHISLMTALFMLNETQHKNNTVFVKGNELRRLSKICSKSTYHKCLQELQTFGYIDYEPCFNHYEQSKVHILSA